MALHSSLLGSRLPFSGALTAALRRGGWLFDGGSSDVFSVWSPNPGAQADCFDLIVNSVYEEIFYGGERFGGKTQVLIGAVGHACRRYGEGFRALFLRDISTLLNGLISEFCLVWKGFGSLSRRDKEFRFNNGAIVKFGYMMGEHAMSFGQGNTFDLILLDEAPTSRALTIIRDLYDRLLGSIRTRFVGFKPKLVLTGNPGGMSQRIIRDRFGIQADGSVLSPSPYRVYIHARAQDNQKGLALDPGYIERLSRLSPTLRSLWLDGNWGMQSAQAFERFDVCVVAAGSISELRGKRLIVGLDWGFSSDPGCVIFAGVDAKTGHVAVINEMMFEGRFPEDIAVDVLKLVNYYKAQGMGYEGCFCDPSVFNKVSGPSIADSFIKAGLSVERSFNDRKLGYLRVRSAIDSGVLFVSDACYELCKTMPTLEMNIEKRIDDIATGQFDHPYDALRYLLIMLDLPAVKEVERAYSQVG